MNILFVHQNFPGQFKFLAPYLASLGHRVHAMTIVGHDSPGVMVHRYQLGRGSSREIHPFATEFETKMIRGEACAKAALDLKQRGMRPDVIVANPGWGESLFLKEVWPQARLLSLFEFFYATTGRDFNFDPEFTTTDIMATARLHAKNAYLLMALASMDGGWSPTHYQRSTVPGEHRGRIEVLFDGIDTDVVAPAPETAFAALGRTFRAGDEIITFVNRNLEPQRGYHVFMRALPEILRQRPNAVALIVGEEGVSYGAEAPAGKSWKQIYLEEVKGELDMSRVFFLGRVSYPSFVKVLQASACHIYLTYPFVLGWSCIEAMSAGCLVVGSRTPPVEEVIRHGENGMLVDFFDIAGLARTVVDVLARPADYAAMRLAARQQAMERYDLGVCLPALARFIGVTD